MIARLNLSSNPFRNRTLPWAVAAAVALVSLAWLFFTLAEYRLVRAQADAGERDLQGLRRERAEIEARANEVREAMPEDERRTLEAAHALVGRKSFSWSRLFADLEAALPAGVRVSRISVRDVAQRGEQTRADLELAVVARTPTDVTDMTRDMQRAGAFFATFVTETQKAGRGETGYEFVLRVNYVQGSRKAAEGEAAVAAGDDGGEVARGRR